MTMLQKRKLTARVQAWELNRIKKEERLKRIN